MVVGMVACAFLLSKNKPGQGTPQGEAHTFALRRRTEFEKNGALQQRSASLMALYQ
jgi:hypothetical protein